MPTVLMPTVMFDDASIYRDGEVPGGEEITARVQMYWLSYHQALRGELVRLRQAHGHVVLWEGHSIRAVVPRLFEGRLPDFNLGTYAGASCRSSLRLALNTVLASQYTFSHVVDGRFKGGYITRHYGAPDDGIDAVQLELAQCNYMDENRFEYLSERAAGVQPLLRRLLQTCLDTTPRWVTGTKCLPVRRYI